MLSYTRNKVDNTNESIFSEKRTTLIILAPQVRKINKIGETLLKPLLV